MFTIQDLKQHQAKDIAPFFPAYRRSAWQPMDEYAANKFYDACVKPNGPIVLWDIVDAIEMVLGIKLSEDELVPRSVYEPDMLRKTLDIAMKGGKMGRFDAMILSQAYEKVRRMFKVPKVKPIPLEQVPYDGSKSAGLPSLRSKAEDYPRALREARKLSRGKCAPQPSIYFHRGKNLEDARPVNGYPFGMNLCEGTFFYPLQQALIQHHTPYSGGRYDFETGTLINEIQLKSERILELDYSKFGITIPAKLTSMAFKILEQNIEMSEEDKVRWELVTRYFHTTPVLAPDGYIYYGKRSGVPDGTNFTQIIDSIVNAICIEYCARRMKFKTTRYQVLGDDSVIGIDRPVSLKALAACLAELGVTLNVKKSAIKHPNEAVHYLGHDWKRGIARREIRDTLIRLVTPERLRPEYLSKDKDIRRAAYIERLRNYQDDNPDAFSALEALILFYQASSDNRKYWVSIYQQKGKWTQPQIYTYYNQFYGKLGLEWNELSRWKAEKRMAHAGFHRGQAVFF